MKPLWNSASLAAAVALGSWIPVSADEIDVVSDVSWRDGRVEWSGWQTLGFDDSTFNTLWQNTVELAVPADYPDLPGDFISGTLGKHVWPPGAPDYAWLRKSFILPGTPLPSQAVIRVDGSFDFYFNGQLLSSGSGKLSEDITCYLRPGLNVFAVKAWNPGGTPAFLFDADVRYQPYPDGWHFEFEGDKPVRLVWPTEAGREYHLRLSDSLATWTPAPRFPRTATSGSLAYEFSPAPKGFFKIVTLPEGFTVIPGGDFQMGDTYTEGGNEELPIHNLFLSPFHLGRTEVTGQLWAETRTWGLANGYTDLPAGSSKGPNHPVHSISWEAMVKWCNALSEKNGLVPCYRISGEVYRTGGGLPDWEIGANGYRLPTEAEWEKAARGGVTGSRFPWGNIINHWKANYFNSSWPYESPQNQGHHPAYATGGEPYTAPVGSFPANAHGLHDMAGNLWERCWDSYDANYYPTSPAIDPHGPAPSTLRALRGGSWDTPAYVCRVSLRTSSPTSTGFHGIGFRLARNAIPDEFVLIPAGSFEMGDAFAEGRENELPTQQITTGPFYMAKYELTKPVWDEVRTWGLTHGYTDLPMGESKGPSHPLRAILFWQEAVKWCNARSEMEGLTPCYTVGNAIYRNDFQMPDCDWNANGYRLPTEAEWERAARGGLSGKRYPWGDTISFNEANYSSSDPGYGNLSPTTGTHPAFNDGLFPYTSPVGSFTPNSFGLYDMTGNVWEWCWNTAYRGGGWSQDPFYCRVSCRNFYDGRPGATNTNIGLRLVRSIIP